VALKRKQTSKRIRPNIKRVKRIRRRRRKDSPRVNIMLNWLREMGFKPVREKTFSWLRNPKTGHSLYLDIFEPKSRIAIEYDGPSHYQVVKEYGMTKRSLMDQKERDQIKDKLCSLHGIRVIRFSCKNRFNRKIFMGKVGSSLVSGKMCHW